MFDLDYTYFTPTIYNPAYSLVTERIIQICYQKNIKMIPWMVNDKTGIERLKHPGMNGIISDYPQLFNE